MHHTTGFDREEIIDLCIRINSVQPGTGSPNWPPCLGLFKSVAATLTYMRHNRTQAEIGESLGVSQPTISRAISAITPLVPEATREFVPTADDLDPDAQYILDGTLLPCWSWDGHKALYSGKHKTTGMNVQVACTIYGKLAWISDPVEREPPRQLLPGRIRRTADDEPEELDRRQRIHREQHDHSLQEACGRRANRLAEGI